MPVASKRRQHARHRPSVAAARHKLGAAVPHRGARAAAPIRKKSKQHSPCAPLTLSTKMKPAHATGHPCVPCFPASNSAYGINKRNRRESKDDAKPLRNSEKQPPQEGKKQKLSDLCNFFSISNPLSSPAKRKYAIVRPITCGFALLSSLRELATVANRKKVARWNVFLFSESQTT